ncbi:hypothetical protein HPB51_022309 [Rhipicephalus microplus]|uniref:Down syndrome cell adhesion molecule n=1 Tax=Rhipicephalus microplus TaxID=6941 RepID=A0A9J6DWH7_RHIMP|nr:hypothetical protein HPB51_022309 [Rhipicephalus microplus]
MSPTLEETFGSVTVKRGEAVSLRCRARGSPTPEISWAIDGDFLYPSQRLRITAERSASDVQSVLNISDARLEDSGEYSCVARNDIATDAHSARVDVEGAPFVRPLRNVTVVSGTLLTLRCPYGGYPLESLVWRKAGMVLPVNYRQSVDNRGRLLVQQALKFADEGEYTCAITGRSQLVASGSTYVSVVVAPTIDEHFFPNVVKVEEGSRSRLMCSVSKGDPPLRFRWLKNGLRISSHGERVIETTDDSSIIKIGRVRFADHGEYTCFVSNDAASVNRSVELVVHVSPRWKIEPQNTSAVLTSTVIMHCSADGHPPPVLTWKKGEIPPKFKEKHRRLVVKKGENLQVHCQAVGDPPTTYFWEKNQKPIDTERYHIKTVEGSGGKSYSLLDMQEPTRDESGVYSCKAKNEHGEDTSHIQVIVQEPPDPPIGVQVTNCTSRSATVQWQTPYNGNSPITRYMLNYKLLNAPSGAPLSLTVHTTGSQSLKVSWKAPKKEQQHGTILGYRVGYRVAHTDDSFQFKQVEVRRVSSHSGVPPVRNEEGDGREAEQEYVETTYLTNLHRLTKYGVVVQAYNAAGTGPASDEVIATTLESAPPTSPSIKALPLSNSSLLVQWEKEKKDDYSVTEYVLHYGTELGEWNKVSLNSSKQSFVLDGLKCGTTYRLYMTASNSIGTGEPGAEVIVRTNGAVSTQSPTAIKDQSAVPFHLNASMVAPLAVCAILMPIAVLLVHIYFKRHRSRRNRAIEQESPDPSKQYFQDAVILSVFNQKEPAMKNSVASSTYYASMSNKTMPLAIKNHRKPCRAGTTLACGAMNTHCANDGAATVPRILRFVPSIKAHNCQT